MQPRVRRSGLVLVLAALPLLLGMGTIGGGQEVIQPPVDFHATLVDKDGTRVDVSRVNIGGRVQLEGDLGRGNLRIPFANINRIDFHSGARDQIQATVHLSNGEPVNLRVRSSLTFYGQTSVGLYEVRARDLEHIEFAR